MDEQVKSSRLLTLLEKVYSYFSFHLPAIQFFISTWIKRFKDISFSSTYFCCYRKHRNKDNNDNKICPLPSSSYFQQHFHKRSYVLRYNSDLPKLEWTLLLFNFNYNCDMTNRRKLFSIPVSEYASFSHQARTLKTNLLGLISIFSKYCFKTDTICLLFLSSHVFTALEFNTNHFVILLWKAF